MKKKMKKKKRKTMPLAMHGGYDGGATGMSWET